MRILIVTHGYAPAASPRAFRWTTLAEAWAADGHEVEVLTSSLPGVPDEELCEGVQVHRVGSRWRPAAGAQGAQEERESLGRRLARSAYRALWQPLQWPDYAHAWRRPALMRAGGLVEPDVIVSVSHPFTPHRVGLELKRRWPKARWIVDVGDPFCFLRETPLNNIALYGVRNERVEGEVLRLADRIAVTCEGTRKEYARHFPDQGEKIEVIGPLLPDFEPQAERPLSNGKLKLVFAGRFYQKIRSPQGVLALMKAMDRRAGVEFHVYGDLGDCREIFSRTKSDVVTHGAVPRGEAMAAMHGADVLVHVGNSTAYQLPSKVVEYAASGRPILNLVSRPDDSSAEFFNGMEGVLTVEEPTSEWSSEQVARVEGWLEGAKKKPDLCREAQLSPYRLPAIKTAYEALW